MTSDWRPHVCSVRSPTSIEPNDSVGFYPVKDKVGTLEVLDFMLVVPGAIEIHRAGAAEPAARASQSRWCEGDSGELQKDPRNTSAHAVLGVIVQPSDVARDSADYGCDGVNYGTILHTTEQFKADFIAVRCSVP